MSPSNKKPTFTKAIEEYSPKFGKLPVWEKIGYENDTSPNKNKMMIANNPKLLKSENPKLSNRFPDLSVEEMSIGRNSAIDEQSFTAIPPRLSGGGTSHDDIQDMYLGSVMVENIRDSSVFKSRDNSLARLAAIKYGFNKQVNVKCKNMKSYDLCFATDRTQQEENMPNVILLREPYVLPGGATIPTALFRDPEKMRSTLP